MARLLWESMLRPLLKPRYTTLVALLFDCRASPIIIEGNQVGWAQFACSKSVLTVPNHLLVLRVSECGLLHSVPGDKD